MRTIAALSVSIALCLTQALLAHPDGAQPVDHSLVVGFERFFAEGDSAEYLAKGGVLLIRSLGCAACHEAPAGWLEVVRPEMAADALPELGRGLDYPALWLAIRNPRSLRNGSRMPEMFAHPTRDPEQVVALASFLHSRKTDVPGEADRWQGGDLDRGRDIFHGIGCAACHAPEVPEGYEKPNVNSITLAVAETYDVATVAGILTGGGSDGGGRHPDFALEAEELRDLVAYLRMPATAGPGIDPAVLAGEPVPDLIDQGERLFRDMRCGACHAQEPAVPPGRMASPVPCMTDLAAGGGCIALEPRPGLPFFSLSKLQREAVTLALLRIEADAGADGWSPDEAADLFLAARNCYACHAWREKGGLEEARAVLMAREEAEMIPSLEENAVSWRSSQCGFRLDEGKNHAH